MLLGGAPGVRPARVVVLGAGNVGWNAAWIAQGMEAEVLLLDKNLDRLRWVDQIHKGRIMTLASNRAAVARAVADADLVIGAVLVPGGRAPVLVTDEMIADDEARRGDRRLRDRPGRLASRASTRRRTATRSTSVHGVLHYAVGNVPGAVPNTSTYALTNATLPYAVELATRGVRDARRAPIRHWRAGVNTLNGCVPNAAVADALGVTPCRSRGLLGARDRLRSAGPVATVVGGGRCDLLQRRRALPSTDCTASRFACCSCAKISSRCTSIDRGALMPSRT